MAETCVHGRTEKHRIAFDDPFSICPGPCECFDYEPIPTEPWLHSVHCEHYRPIPAPAVPHPQPTCGNFEHHKAHSFELPHIKPGSSVQNCPGVAVPHPETRCECPPNRLYHLESCDHWGTPMPVPRSTSPQHDDVDESVGLLMKPLSMDFPAPQHDARCNCRKVTHDVTIHVPDCQHDAPDFDAAVMQARAAHEALCLDPYVCVEDGETDLGCDRVVAIVARHLAALASQPVHHDACGFDALRELDLIASEAVHSHCPNIANRIGIVLAALRSKADSQKEAGPHPSCDVPTLPEHHTTKADSSDALVEIVLKAFADEDALFEKQKNGGPGYAAWVEKWRDNQRRGRQWSLELAAALRSLGAKEWKSDWRSRALAAEDALSALGNKERDLVAKWRTDAAALWPLASGSLAEHEIANREKSKTILRCSHQLAALLDSGDKT